MPKWKSGHGRRSSSIQRCLPFRRTASTRRPRSAAAKRDGAHPVVHDRVGGDGHGGDAQAAQGPLGATPRGLDLGQLGHSRPAYQRRLARAASAAYSRGTLGRLDAMALPRFCSHCAAPLPSPPPVTCRSCDTSHWLDAKPCAGALVARGGKLMLVRRAHEPWRGAWDVPGGFCGPREHPADAAEREVREETGLAVRVGSVLGMWIDTYAPEGKDADKVTLNIYFHATAGPAPRRGATRTRWRRSAGSRRTSCRRTWPSRATSPPSCGRGARASSPRRGRPLLRCAPRAPASPSRASRSSGRDREGGVARVRGETRGDGHTPRAPPRARGGALDAGLDAPRGAGRRRHLPGGGALRGGTVAT